MFEALRLRAVRRQFGALAEHPAFARDLLGGAGQRRQQHLVEPVDRVEAGDAVGQRLARGADEDARTPAAPSASAGRHGGSACAAAEGAIRE